jgi:membrane protease YdiL (CAAX protease family)
VSESLSGPASPIDSELPGQDAPPATRLTPLRQLPHLGHALLFFVLILPLLAAGQYAGLLIAQQLHVFGNRPMQAYLELAQIDARLSLPPQALAYALAGGVVALLFSLLWRRPFAEGIHWRAAIARRWAVWLMILGLVTGFGISLLGAALPMPKDPPILVDMMHSATGAWMMLVFAVTLAPAFEELAFRGFLLPAFVNSFGWLVRKGDISAGTAKWVGAPISILLTSLPFALLHGQQVSHAWGPLLLIGVVSIVLCTVRLVLDSVAASTIVHAAYNFTLFAGILIQTSAFTHLEKLKQ